MSYQQEVFERFSDFRNPAKFPIYPPYHKGPYLEEYFCNLYMDSETQVSDKIYIPIFWTHCYNDGCDWKKLQQLLNELDPSYSYFTVMTHDDAPRERLPENTVCYSGGGLAGDIPIPLICSGFEDVKQKERDIFCSFRGSMTHPIRKLMCQSLPLPSDKYHVYVKGWTPQITQEQEHGYREAMERSVFSLCPRGYGPTSFRTYEAMQLGSIPVYIYDKPWLPWQDQINWTEISVLLHQSRISEIDLVLSSYSEQRIEKMQNRIAEVYNEYFTLDGTCKKILESL